MKVLRIMAALISEVHIIHSHALFYSRVKSNLKGDIKVKNLYFKLRFMALFIFDFTRIIMHNYYKYLDIIRVQKKINLNTSNKIIYNT